MIGIWFNIAIFKIVSKYLLMDVQFICMGTRDNNDKNIISNTNNTNNTNDSNNNTISCKI